MAEAPDQSVALVEKLAKQLECSICLEILKDPKALACLHIYCKECVGNLLLRHTRDDEITCPQCRKMMTVVGNSADNLPTVFFINGMIEFYHVLKKAESSDIACQSCSNTKAVAFCESCPERGLFICPTCVSAHESMKVFQSHTVVSLSDLKQGSTIHLPVLKDLPQYSCSKHDNEHKKLYCYECSELICRDCTLVDHAGHKYDFVQPVAAAFREKILASVAPLRNVDSEASQTIAQLESLKSTITKRGANITEEIYSSYDRLIAIVEQHKQTALKKASEIVEDEVNAIVRQQEDVQLMQATVESLVDFVENTMENACDEELAAMKGKIVKRIDEVSKSCKEVKLDVKEPPTVALVPPPCSELKEVLQKGGLVTVEWKDDNPCKPVITQSGESTCLQLILSSSCGNNDVSAELTSHVDGSVVQPTVRANRYLVDTYKVSFTPVLRGRYHLAIRMNDEIISTREIFAHFPPTKMGTPVSMIEGLMMPDRIAITDWGLQCVTEYEANRYTILNASGERLTTVETENCHPRGIAVDSSSCVYVASSDHKLRKYNAQGELVKSTGDSLLKDPSGLTIHDGRIYVCDSKNGRIRVFDIDLNLVETFGEDVLKRPVDIAFDGKGDMYVADINKHQVLVFAANRQLKSQISRPGRQKGELSNPCGLHVAGGYVYVSESGNNRISVFDTFGKFVASFGSPGSQKGQFNYPVDVTIDRDGFCYVCDTYNNRIQVF